MYNCMFVSALPVPTCNSEKSANGGNRQILLLLLLSLLSQSLLVFFLRISRAQTMHLEHQSLKSIILFIH